MQKTHAEMSKSYSMKEAMFFSPAILSSLIKMGINERIKFFFVYQHLPSLSVIMCCSPICEVLRASTHYTRALQMLIHVHGKECYIVIVMVYEPHHEKTGFWHMRKQRRRSAFISFAVTVKLISAFVFATRIVQSLYFLNPKFQASSHLL